MNIPRATSIPRDAGKNADVDNANGERNINGGAKWMKNICVTGPAKKPGFLERFASFRSFETQKRIGMCEVMIYRSSLRHVCISSLAGISVLLLLVRRQL